MTANKRIIDDPSFHIVPFQVADIASIVDLFYGAVYTVNQKDYTPQELEAWAPPMQQRALAEGWLDSLRRHMTYVAKKEETIVGFGDLCEDGYLDRLYVHKDYQQQGIATILMSTFEKKATDKGITQIVADVSVTAMPFFKQCGFTIVRSQYVERNGILLHNVKMKKGL